MSDKPGPDEVTFWIDTDAEFATLHADEFRTAMRERDQLRAEVARLEIDRNAAKETANVCHALHEEALTENERLRAQVKDAEAVIELGKVWWLARGHSRAVAEAAFEEAVAAYDPAAWQT